MVERTPQLKRGLFKVSIESSAEKSLGDQEDASKQGRNGIDQDEEISWFQEDAETQGSINITTAEPVTTANAPVTTASVFVTTVEPSTPLTTTILIEDEDLIIASETVTRPIVPPQQQLDPKDKGKGIMQEPEKPVKVKRKDQITFDQEVARRLEA
ncbi:hypothetical protein Tco_0043903 [Tanacetum coccineum]